VDEGPDPICGHRLAAVRWQPARPGGGGWQSTICWRSWRRARRACWTSPISAGGLGFPTPRSSVELPRFR